jgi:hypothetical protein
VQIGANGVLLFRSQSSTLNPHPAYPPLLRPQLAINRVLIAPFWTYMNNNDIVPRQIFYRYSDNQTLRSEVGSLISNAFQDNFSPSFLFVATWDRQRQYTNSQQVSMQHEQHPLGGQTTPTLAHHSPLLGLGVEDEFQLLRQHDTNHSQNAVKTLALKQKVTGHLPMHLLIQ